MNIVAITGRLTSDPDVRYTQANQPMAVAKFTCAVNRDRKVDGQPDADFIRCVAFGKTAEFIEKYFKKGNKIEIRGRWQTGSYKNDKGETVYTNDCMIEQVGFAESKSGSESHTQSAPAKTDEDGFMNIPDGIYEELPFL